MGFGFGRLTLGWGSGGGGGLGAFLASIGALWSGGDDGSADQYLTTGDGRILTRGP